MDKKCPFYDAPCIEHACIFYQNLVGKNPQTGVDVNNWGCVINFIPLLLLENTKAQRETNATVQEFRTESNAHNSAVGTSMAALSYLARQVNGNDDHKRISAGDKNSGGNLLPDKDG